MREGKEILTEIAVLRPLAIMLLIVYHAFACYDGRWKPFDGMQECELYAWLARINEFIPALFVFISGYVYSYQKNEQGKICSYRELLSKKLKRLYVPAVFFSVLYFVLFLAKEKLPILDQINVVFSGAGHLWFLPVLFWCFVVGEPLTQMKWKLGERGKLLILAVFSTLGWLGMALHLPLGLNRLFFYSFFFYFGYLAWRNKQSVIEKIIGADSNFNIVTISLLVLSIVAMLIKQKVELSLPLEVGLVEHSAWLSVVYFLRFLEYLTLVSIVFIVTLKYIEKRGDYKFSNALLTINTFCFSIYIYHQFVLQIVYYYTPIPDVVNPYLLPWVGFLITVLMSFALAYISLKNRLGRELLG